MGAPPASSTAQHLGPLMLSSYAQGTSDFCHNEPEQRPLIRAQSANMCQLGLQDPCLDHCPNRGASPGAVKHRVDEQSCLCSSQQDQQHKGCHHRLINAAAAGFEGDVRDGHETCHHIDQPCQIPGEINPGISAANKRKIFFQACQNKAYVSAFVRWETPAELQQLIV